MAETNYSRRLKEKLVEAINKRIEALSSGSAQDYAEYRLEVGLVTGLKEA